MAKNKIEGLGDVVAKFTEVFGIDKATKYIFDAFGKDCGCDARREAWNKKYPIGKKKPECLTEGEFEFLDTFFNNPPWTVNGNIDGIKHQKPIRQIHDRIFKVKTGGSGCGSCVMTMIRTVEEVYKDYKDEEVRKDK